MSVILKLFLVMVGSTIIGGLITFLTAADTLLDWRYSEEYKESVTNKKTMTIIFVVSTIVFAVGGTYVVLFLL